MAARRSSSRDLWRGLAEAPHPCWVIDDQRRVALVNRAALSWLGLPDDSVLTGRRCCGENNASADPLDRAATRLAPPEAVYAGTPQSLCYDRAPDAALEILFIPLPNAGDELAHVLALGGVSAAIAPRLETLDTHAVRQLWARQSREWANQLPRAPVLLGSSLAAEHLRRQTAIAAQCSANVALLGPRGAGLDALARGLHHQPPQAGPMVAIDAPLMDAELLDASLSHLVAHLADRPESRAAVLLRDGDGLPADAQDRLEQTLVAWDGRLRVFTLARKSLLRSAGFAPRLAHRLSTLELMIPALRARAEDIPQLAQLLLDRRQTPERVIPGWSRAALDRLVAYPWPGDLEELSDCVRNAAAQARLGPIGPDQLPVHIRSYRPGSSVADRRDQQIVLDRFLRRIERELIERTVDAARGNRAEAARRLGISRTRLLRRLAELRRATAPTDESSLEGDSTNPL